MAPQLAPIRAPARQEGNVLADRAAVDNWARERGLEGIHLSTLDRLETPSEPARLILRTIRYQKEERDGLTELFRTSALLTESSAQAIDSLGLMRMLAKDKSVAGLREAEDKEKSLFLKKEIEGGSVLFVERPSILIPTYLSAGSLPLEQTKLFSAIFERLSSKTMTQVDGIRQLSNQKHLASCQEEGIVRTNGIAVRLGDGQYSEVYSAVFARMSRINHS
jgi:hypothetical protein